MRSFHKRVLGISLPFAIVTTVGLCGLTYDITHRDGAIEAIREELGLESPSAGPNDLVLNFESDGAHYQMELTVTSTPRISTHDIVEYILQDGTLARISDLTTLDGKQENCLLAKTQSALTTDGIPARVLQVTYSRCGLSEGYVKALNANTPAKTLIDFYNPDGSLNYAVLSTQQFIPPEGMPLQDPLLLNPQYIESGSLGFTMYLDGTYAVLQP